MATSTGTSGGSGLSRSEAAILAWKKRARAAKPGALDPKIAARVKEILAAKQKKKDAALKPKGGKGKAKGAGGKGKAKADPEKVKAKAERDKEKADAKVEREKNKAERTTERAAAKQEREKNKQERATAAVAKQQAAQAKLKQAAQAQKEKAKAKAKAGTPVKQDKEGVSRETPKDAAAKETATNRAKVAKDMADQDVGLNAPAATALSDFADGKPLKPEAAAEFEKMGIVEKDEQGNHRLTSEGRAAAAAMSKGDTRAAVDAISRAGDKKKPTGDNPKADKEKAAQEKADREQGDLLASVADNPKKLGFRQAGDLERAGLIEKTKDGYQLSDKGKAKIAARQKEIDASKAKKAIDMDELEIKAGARHSKMDASHLDEAARHLHAAGATCPDCAADEDDPEPTSDDMKAIKGIMDDPGNYAAHECSDVAQAASALSNIAMLIASELYEDDEDDTDVSQLCDAARILVKFIGSELDELEGAAGDAAAGRTAGDVPMAKSIELGTLPDGEELATLSGYAIKAMGAGGLVGGYLVKFGGEGDLSQYRDVFTKSTNFGSHTKSDVWVHHRMLPGLGKKQLTNQAELGMDDEGVFVKHLLDLRSSYERKLYDMVQAGKLGWSSGTAPHLVERKAMGDGRHEITRWTLGLDASYTPMPAGGFSVDAGAMKSLFDDAGIDLLNAMFIDDGSQEAVKSNSTRPDGVEVDAVRSRALLLELSLMELEETAR